MNVIKRISFLFILLQLFSCNDEKSIFRINKPITRITDSTSAIIIDLIPNDYSLVKVVRNNNSIQKILFTNDSFNLKKSELYTFYEDEYLKDYYLFENDSTYKFKVIFDKNKNFVDFSGKLGIFLDSVCTNTKNENFLYFSYPRIPYYDIKARLVLMYDTTGDFDTIFPILRGNCYMIQKIRSKNPLYIQADLQLVHLINKSSIDLAESFKTDTIKKSIITSKLSLYYYKEIDYNKYPFFDKD